MGKNIYICAAVILFFSVVGFLAWNNLELYERTVYSYPSDEVIYNNYYALEQWLKENGISVRLEKNITPEKIAAAPEKVVLIQSHTVRWENAEKYITPWLEQGGVLVISLDSNTFIDDRLTDYLYDFGITVDLDSSYTDYPGGDDVPYFDWYIQFDIEDGSGINTINDNSGIARLVKVSVGEGTLIVTGRMSFMYNDSLSNEADARLSWELTGAYNTKILFVRDRYVSQAMFGKIIEKGNFLPVWISVLLVIFIGFWMVIPVFGLLFEEKQKNSRPIKERFDAEINILKKYNSLNYYLETYEREYKLDINPESKMNYNYSYLINQLRSIQDGKSKS